MNFTDYPKDLQRIVELTPGGWLRDYDGVNISGNETVWWHVGSGAFMYTRDQYEACRAAWLADRVDWRGLCEELTAVIDGFIEMWDGPKYAMHMIENVQAARPVSDKARKALEQTK